MIIEYDYKTEVVMLFSFSDLWERLRDRWNDTVKPSWKNLLSERQNTLNLFSVIVILELLLCILFLSFANNLAIVDDYCAHHGVWRGVASTSGGKLKSSPHVFLFDNHSVV